jgi:hypothetical protein
MSGMIFKDREFSEPVVLQGSTLSTKQGIYAILVPDMSFFPWPYRVLFFGEADNIAKHVTPKHAQYNEWVGAAAGAELYVAVHNTGRMTAKKRQAAENELVSEFEPCCNQLMSCSAV